MEASGLNPFTASTADSSRSYAHELPRLNFDLANFFALGIHIHTYNIPLSVFLFVLQQLLCESQVPRSPASSRSAAELRKA